jgi:stage IV sporulation protein FB
VLLSEPPRTPYDLNFSVLGIPVRVHPLFWAAALLLGLGGSDKPAEMVVWIGAVFISILFHELGHAAAARAHGWQPWITLYGFGGLASYRPTHRSPRSQILISLAGPGAGFLFAGFVLASIAASGHEVAIGARTRSILPIAFEFYSSPYLNQLIFDLLYINIFWGLVNLLPIYPLDGGHVAREMLGLVSPADGLRQSLWLSVIAATVVAVLGWTQMHVQFLAMFFAYLAYSSYAALRDNFGPGGGLGGWR